MKSTLLSRLVIPALLLATPLAALAESQWIWTSKIAKENSKAVFKKSFTVAGPVKTATLLTTCDNGATAVLNGKTVAENPDWDQPVRATVTKEIKAGLNELVFHARNRDGIAALVATLTIETADGKKQVIETNAEWLSADGDSADFKPAVEIAKYGSAPWGDVFAGGGEKSRGGGGATDPAGFKVADGFKVELLYSVPKAEQGSWVSLTEDAKGRLIAGDQYGGIFQITVPPIGTTEGAKVEPIKLPDGISGKPLGGAHGLLYAFNSLYLMNNEFSDKGLWRLRDANGNDEFDKGDYICKLSEGGEHGVHAVVLGPDDKSIYFVAGNHTKLPGKIDVFHPASFAEDNIVTRMWDPNGHAKGILSPGGYICKADPECKRIELFAGGFRNQYDFAFDANGEMFAYDSDMEWDMGTPWYMPTRINHVVSGGDYGWHSGSGRWPAYYEDSLPACVDIGPGSPTGAVFGTGAKFPAKYQRAMFALDWTYATLWAIHFTPDGATYKAEKEDFIAGRGFSLTDAVIRKEDGALYVTIGGRRNQSGLYRITYVGKESTAPVGPLPLTPEAKTRRALEALQMPGTGPEAIAKAWPFLGSKDRFLRFAARVAIEHQPAATWAEKALSEKNPQAAVEAFLAVARAGDKTLQPRLIAALAQFDLAKLPEDLRIQFLRAWEVTFTRMGRPAPEVCAQIAAKLDPLFPSAEPYANRELVGLLTYLGSTSIVGKTVPMLATAKDSDITLSNDEILARNTGYGGAVAGMNGTQPNRQAIAYVNALREAKTGWTPDLRKAYFGWFPTTSAWRGGNSFRKFLEQIRKDALANIVADETERAALDELSKKAPPAPPADIVMPKGPGKNYTTADVVALATGNLTGRNFEQGKAMFTSTLCIRCHHFNGDGGNIGPDLTGAGQRYTLADLAENIVEPSKVISDQYGTEQIDMKDGGTIVGRVLVEENGKLFVMTNALVPEQTTTVDASQIKKRSVFNVSMMPPGLINGLNKDELLDLIAYIQAGGNPADKSFKK